MDSKIDDIYKFVEDAGDNNIPAKKVLEYLDALQLKQLSIRHHIKHEEFLNGMVTCMDLKSIADYLGNFLYSLIGKENSLIVISFFSNEKSEFVTESICGCPKLLSVVQQMVDDGLLSLTMKSNVNDISLMYENRLIKMVLPPI